MARKYFQGKDTPSLLLLSLRFSFGRFWPNLHRQDVAAGVYKILWTLFFGLDSLPAFPIFVYYDTRNPNTPLRAAFSVGTNYPRRGYERTVGSGFAGFDRRQHAVVQHGGDLVRIACFCRIGALSL